MDIRPGPRNLITDVAGLTVGNAHDPDVRSGVTVILPDDPMVAAADIRGGAPGTRETDLLDPANSVAQIHGLVLSGGSVFGLDAASATVNWLAQRGRGLAVGAATVPIVPAAILFDLLNGGAKAWGAAPPYGGLARHACDLAARDFTIGSAGAGYGAQAGALQGGLGSTSAQTGDGLVVGALVAANPVGSTVMPDGRTFWAWPWEQAAEYGANPPPAAPPPTGASLAPDIFLSGARPAANTTLAVVATNAVLTKAQARRVAIMAHDGIARAVRPAHTPFDGDSVFCLATGVWPLPAAPQPTLATIGALAADCTARAIARAVYAAADIGAAPIYRRSP